MDVIEIEQRLIPPVDYVDEFYSNMTDYVRRTACQTRHPGDWPPREFGQHQLRNTKDAT
jgi:hypothetical protein